MKKLILILMVIFTLTSCKRGCQSFERSVQASDRNYEIIMYSGGDTVFYDKFRGIVNNSEHSDGVYYYDMSGKLVEVSGDYVIHSSN